MNYEVYLLTLNMAIASARQIQKSGLTRSIFDSGQFLPILGTALGAVGAGAVADMLSNAEGLSMKDLFGATKTIAKQYTPAMAQKKIMNAGNKIKDTGKKISDSGAFQAVKQKAGFGDKKQQQQISDSDFATEQELSPEFGGGNEEEQEENEENEEYTPEEKPYQPFSKSKPEEEELDKKKKEKQEKEKTPRERDQERSKQFQQSKDKQRLTPRKGNKKEEVKRKKTKKEKKEKDEPGIQYMSSYIIWFIFRDILNIFLMVIPFVGQFISGILIAPFVGLTFFMIAKQDKKHKLALTKEISVKWEFYGIIYIFSMALAVYMIDKKLKLNSSIKGTPTTKK